MVHLPPQPHWRRSVDRLSGIAVVLLGVVVAIYALLALHQPRGKQAAGIAPGTSSPSVSITSTRSATPTPTPTPSATSTASATATTSASSDSATSTSAAQLKLIPLVVLNNTAQTGLAHVAALRFIAGGWKVSSEGNLVNDILSTCAYYDPSNPQNLAAADLLQSEFPAIKRIRPRFSGLPAAPIVVVLTSDYS